MDKDCAIADLYESLKHCKGETVLPGLRPELLGISKSQITSYPKLPKPSDEGATMESIASYDGTFGLAADAAFHHVDILTTASSLKTETQGEYPSKTFINTLAFKYAGNNEKASGYARLANSDDMLYIARMRDGKYRVIGNDSFETEVKVTQESGQSVTDASGTSMEVTATDICPAPFFTGKIKTDKGMLDCATGEYEAVV